MIREKSGNKKLKFNIEINIKIVFDKYIYVYYNNKCTVKVLIKYWFESGMEKYSSGWRGAPAKGVGRLRGARVQIPPSPLKLKQTSLSFLIRKKLKK